MDDMRTNPICVNERCFTICEYQSILVVDKDDMCEYSMR